VFRTLDLFANYMFRKCKDNKMQPYSVGIEDGAIVPTIKGSLASAGQREDIAVGQKLFKREAK
jgi:hypothetical protein